MEKYKAIFKSVTTKVRIAIYAIMIIRVLLAIIYRIYCINRVNED